MKVSELLEKLNSGERDLCGADLRGADLSGADLREADLSRANLSGANLSYANLSGARLCGADLSDADLSGADLSGARLCGANLSGSDLSEADLSRADLTGANLSGADLSYADLTGANLSGAFGLLSAREFLAAFEQTERGLVVYKATGSTSFPSPPHWVIRPGAVLTEVVNPCRNTLCGSGVNFAPLDWVKAQYPNAQYWRCLIEWSDLADVVVPYGTDGKARCARLTLLELVS